MLIFFACLNLRQLIGVGRFKILGGGGGGGQGLEYWGGGGQGLEYWGGGGGKGGPNFQQAHDVASTSLRRHVPTRFLINQCQIITVLILKSDIIENTSLRIELKGIVLPVQVGGLLGVQRVCWPPPPSQIIVGGGGLAPPPSSSYAYAAQ